MDSVKAVICGVFSAFLCTVWLDAVHSLKMPLIFGEIVGIPWRFIDKMIGHLVEAVNWNQLNNGNNLSALTQCSTPQILFNIFFFLPLKILPKMEIL